MQVEHTPGAAVDRYKVLGKNNRYIELETNRPLVKRLNRTTPHTWKLLYGHIKPAEQELIIKAIEKHWEESP